ncbi:hypothetical protein HPB50_018926 [Hyalomma asiaticum]|uniref:Uncharacterized protein n=2 Tax=Hyalomma asiaticum TaxID=266040 RepID=A0ACB7RKK7_HYAAI|nr:hypothetical protein HPB50_005419 [Hyalomma asiaticum]KAH6922766.1 hypothetical protein HPB50_018926 [Hyalomma asiaticum]
MVGCGGRVLHRLCDARHGANWRPVRLVDESTLAPYACCVCLVIPSTTVVLPCLHAVCEQCLTGCVNQDGGRVCPMDLEPFSEDECQKLNISAKTKKNLKAHCWNADKGCEFTGTMDALLRHYGKECAFHAFQCALCQRTILRIDLAAHYVSGCAESNRQDRSTGCHESTSREQVPTIETIGDDLFARLKDISQAFSGLQRAWTWTSIWCDGHHGNIED